MNKDDEEEVIEVTDDERMESTIFDEVAFDGEPPETDGEEPADAASNRETSPPADGLRAAVRADLQPLRALLADAVQSGEAPDALDWDRVTEQVLSGTQIADALNEEWLAALVRAHGGTEAELRALLAEVITLSTHNDDTTEP